MPDVIAELIAEVGRLWHEQHQNLLAARPRRRAVGAGAKHKFVFVDRLPATLVSSRHGTTHDVLGLLVRRGPFHHHPCHPARCGHCSLNEAAPSRPASGCALSPRSLSTWAPAVGPGSSKDRDRFVSGKTKQNAVKVMVLTDTEERVLFCSPVRPGSCADITQARQLGLVELLMDSPSMEILAMPATRAWARTPADAW
ncbi:transposase family protein [Streptomyces canus]|uniref:transposase family protein n=1 Tax=Streptomyces canus TaxID=58343 RepID=UPI0032448DF6